MKTLLAFLLVLSSAVIGAVFGRSRRPLSALPLGWAIVVALGAAALSEVATVLWIGPPAGPLQPVMGGVLLGFAAGFFSGRRPKPPDKDVSGPDGPTRKG